LPDWSWPCGRHHGLWWLGCNRLEGVKGQSIEEFVSEDERHFLGPLRF